VTLHGSYDGATNDTPAGPLEGFRYYFQWGENTDYGHTTATPPGEDGGAHAETIHVSAQITGLTPQDLNSQPYHYRLVVTNSTGTTFGKDKTFTTKPPDAPQVSNIQVGGILPTSATLTASINPGAAATVYKVEYGTTAKYSSATPDRSLVAGESDQAVSTPLDQLSRGTLYHYRVVATNSMGTTASPDQTFTTPSVPVIESSSASVGTSTAHLTVSVIANARPTEVRFEYGDSASYGTTTAPIQIGPSLLAQAVGVDLSGLQPGTTYHFRGLAANEIGTATGADQTFTTLLAPVAVEKGESKSKACKRGFVKRKGKCVRKHKKRNKKHKRRSARRQRTA